MAATFGRTLDGPPIATDLMATVPAALPDEMAGGASYFGITRTGIAGGAGANCLNRKKSLAW